MNRQTFELLILGSSSASPTSERNPSAQLLNIAERYFLIDCGEATQIQLRRFKAKFQAIDHIFISHLHGDHFFGLPGLLSSMHLLGRKQDITVYCPEPLKGIMDLINKASETRFSFAVHWKFTSQNGLNLLFEDQKVQVYSFPLRHRIFCTGFLFREKPLLRNIRKDRLAELNISTADILNLKQGLDVISKDGKLIRNEEVTIPSPPGRVFAYCSDTVFDPAVCEYINGADLLYHESTFLEDQKERAAKTFHSTAKQAAEIAKLSGARRLLLGHYSARYGDLNAFLEEAAGIFPDCELAADGKKIKI